MWDNHSNTLSKLFCRAIGSNTSYDCNTPHFSNHTSTTMKAFIHNQIQDEKVFRYCYKTRGLFVHKVVPKSIEKWTSHAANSKLLVNIFPCVESCKNYFKDNRHNCLRCSYIYPWNYLSLEAHGFPHGRDYVYWQVSVHIFAPNRDYCLSNA